MTTILVDSGLDQECNMLGLCYNFYNARQIEGGREKDGELAISFADDMGKGRGLQF